MRQSIPWTLRIVGFLAVIAIVGGLSQAVGLKYWMPRINDRSLNVYLYQRENIAPDVLIVGSSKALRGLIPAVIDGELAAHLGRRVTSFSVAQLNASCFASSMVLRDVLASNASPKIIIYEASPGALNANSENIPDALRYYASFPDVIRSAPWLTSGDRMNAAVTGCFRGFANLAFYAHHRAFPHGLTAGLEKLLRRQGRMYGTTASSNVRLSELSLEHRRGIIHGIRSRFWVRHMDSFRIGGAAEAGFHRSCRLAEAHGIPLIVFNPPVTDVYRQLIFSDAISEEYHQFMTRVEQTEGLDFHDLDSGVIPLTEDDFMDFGHLNNDGARKLSTFVATEILAPILRR